MSHVMLIGAGGNIGSHLVPHLARMPEIHRLTLVDRDRYEARNLRNQDAPRQAIGRRKALVQAARVRALNPRLEVQAVVEDVEQMPIGALRADLILTGLDSRRARQRVNYAVRGLGGQWLDAGVLEAGQLARISRFASDEPDGCLECGWDERDYAALEQSYPCDPSPRPVPTGASSALGGLAAALLALECGNLLRGDPAALAPGTELVVDATNHHQMVTRTRRFAECRLAEHAPWPIEPLPLRLETPLSGALTMAGDRIGANGSLVVSIEGGRIARRLTCADCGAARTTLRIAGRLRPGDSRCPSCGGATAPSGFGLVERLEASALTREERRRTLLAVGFRYGEVIRASAGDTQQRFELVRP
jgi:molybdopterin/thiamine biosynthesis adenylyltransferase